MLKLLLSYPAACVVSSAEATWIAWGIEEDEAGRLASLGGPANERAAALCRERGDAAVLKVELSGGAPVRVVAWKGLTACHEIFYAVRPDGVVMADHFRNLLASLPVAERAPSEAVLAEHCLFRTIPAPNTYARAARRLGRGEWLTLDLLTGALDIRLFDRVDDIAERRPLDEHVARIDHALEAALAPWRAKPDAATLFSGGVDSTLVQTYLRPAAPPVMFVLSDYDAEFETRYARKAADLLGVDLRCHTVSEHDYLDKLEQAIDATGMPPPHLQLAFYREMFDLDHSTFVMGETADAVFGVSAGIARLASYFASPAGLRLLRGAAPLLAAAGERGRLLPSLAGRLAGEPSSPFGYGAQVGVYTDYPLVEQVFGPEMVRERLAARLEGMLERVTLAAPPRNRFLRHLEVAHMLRALREDIVMCFRHLAHARGKVMISPFMARAVVDSALAVPVAERYLSGFQGKHLLKRVLKRRLPGYDTSQRKGYTHIAFDRYYREGPLAGIWERYAVPDLFQGAARERLLARPTQVTWDAITLAIWEERLCRNPDLKPLPNARTLTWEAAPAAAAAAAGRR